MRALIFVATALAAATASADTPSGSAGGTIGKQGRSASGDNEAAPDRPPAKEASPRASPPAAGSVGGRWQWNGNCGIGGTYSGEFQLIQGAGGQLTGSFLSDSGAFKGGQISGTVRGKQVSFTRKGSAGEARYTAVLNSTDAPRRMDGTSQFLAVECTFTAVKG